MSTVKNLLVMACIFLSTNKIVLSQPAPKIPLEVLFGNPEKCFAKISPDGTQVAYLAPVNGVLNIWIKTIGKQDDKAVTYETKREVWNYFWASNGKQILYSQDTNGDENYHLYSIDLTNSSITDFTPFPGVKAHAFPSFFPQKDELLISMNKDNAERFDVYHLDLNSGALTMVEKNPGSIVHWVADAELQVRAAITTNDDGTQTLLVRESLDQPWKSLLQVDFDDTLKDELHCGVLGFSHDGSSLYLISSIDTDTQSLIEIDIKTGKRTLLATDPVYDIAWVVFNFDTHKPEIVCWNKERLAYQVLDKNLTQDFERMRSLSKGDINFIRKTDDQKKWVLGFTHDDQSYEHYLYDFTTQQGPFLFQTRPALNKYQLAKMEPISFTTRDGLTIHGYLTCPVGVEAKNLPLVVNVHGGPFWRDDWGYDPEAQWLANQGYACLQINFRGSSGYGKAFLAAGNGEWGRKMHYDLLDGIQWAVKKGIADPSRVAIFGGSYGGYAALVGATFTPDTFRCAVDFVGVSNLLTFLQTLPPYWRLSQWEKRVGSLNDEEFLKSRSPLYHLDELKIPLFIAHGANDVRVKQAESEQIVAKLKEKNIPHEYLLFTDEGHGIARPENRMIFYKKVENFLAKYL